MVCGHLPNPLGAAWSFVRSRTDGRKRTEAEVDAAWVLNVAAAIGKRTSKAKVLPEKQQPRLSGLSPVLCWRSWSVALRARTGGALLPSIERPSSWSPTPLHGSRFSPRVFVCPIMAKLFVLLLGSRRMYEVAAVTVRFFSGQESFRDGVSHIFRGVPYCIVIPLHSMYHPDTCVPCLLIVAAAAFNTIA